jgi:predicted protein tyrosine phosphatase
MPLKFIVTDRSGIEAGVLVKSSYIVISIHDTYSPPARVKKQSGLRAMLQLAFDDAELTDSADVLGAVVMMTTDQANAIWAFVEQHRNDVGAVVVHCEAGVSRSPAIAAALCKGLGGNDRHFFKRYQPNMHVYRLMLEAGRRAGAKNTMPGQNSSITRVRPFFKQLLAAQPTGAGWLASLLRSSTANPEFARPLADDPGELLPSCSAKRIYPDRVLGNVSLEQCFEKTLQPPERFLLWLIEHPELMSWPREKGGRERTYSSSTQRRRKMMLDADNPTGVAETKSEALRQLARLGVSGSERKWWMFEGSTEADCCLETESLVLVIEGKRNEGLSPATHWFPQRNQLWRNVEAAAAYAAGKRYAVLLLAETPVEAGSTLDASLPHLAHGERRLLAQHYLGCVTWRDACRTTGVDYSKLPDTNDDATESP